ncbi:hypothetical protein EAS64_38590 [Trebonia kvetii]|uniref:DUF2637 domain-containing protein n=1 Tax=Trebonia kvetii TaxID=2480626 RepID=A0A6P2BLQ9_9ACTN|nr:hypothetical protein [Trebonia kvetii]TVY99998.1 hypothetical protein EAS64_38590 [Trebonia kvetii]
MAPEIPPSLSGLAGPQDPPGGRGAAVPAAFFPQDARPGTGRGQVWLLVAAIGLFALSAAAATVSYGAQYRLVDAARHLGLAAAMEAAIPDAAALVFACLGVALAVRGRRAIRARLLNLASAGASVFMNVIAAAPGWRNLAVWAMPPAAYALASDTLIAVVRTGAVARRDERAPDAGTSEASLLAALTGLALWLLRLSFAPRSTVAGFRNWVIEECPVAPGRRAARPAQAALSLPAPAPLPSGSARPAGPGRPGDDLPSDGTGSRDSGRDTYPIPSAVARPPARTGAASRSRRTPANVGDSGTKTARFLALVTEEHGPLAGIPLESVARICSVSAPLADLNTGSARTALRRAVLAASSTQNETAKQDQAKGEQ